MKIEEKERTITRSGELLEGDFGMDLADAPHIFSILRDRLYSDKIAAPIREYSTNATDAHTEAGIPNTPIVVTLPSAFDPIFKVRDFGAGLSRAGVFDVYVKYGRSTKRNTNDAIGQLGLGCKSAFTYGDNFTITSYYEGKKSVYNAYIDETGVGKVAFMHEQDSTEPSGMEIAIPVKREDIVSFQDKAKRIFSFFRVPPTVRGVSGFEIYRPVYAFESDGWAVFSGDRRDRAAHNYRSIAVMGDIGYPLNAGAISDLPPDLSALLQADLRLDFEIGELTIAASREALEYSQHSVRNIKKKLRHIQATIATDLAQKVKDCKTEFQAYCKLGDVLGDRTDFGRQAGYIIGKTPIQWGNRLLNKFELRRRDLTDNVGSVVLMDASNRYWRSAARYETSWYEVLYTSHVHFAIKDLSERWVQRAEVYFEELKKSDPNVQLFIITEVRDKKLWKELKITEAEAKKLSEIDISHLKDDTVGAAVKVKNKKHSLQCFYLNWDKIVEAVGRLRSACWEPDDIDLDDAGVYVELDRFNIKFGEKTHDPSILTRMCNELKVAGINLQAVPIIGIKTKSLGKIGDKMIRLEDLIEKKVATFLEDKGVHQQAADYEAYQNHGVSSFDADRFVGAEELFSNPADPLLEYAEALREMRSHSYVYRKYTELLGFYRELGLLDGIKPSYDLDSLQKKMLAKYPLLKTLGAFEDSGRNGSAFNSRDVKHIIQYVNSINSQETTQNE